MNRAKINDWISEDYFDWLLRLITGRVKSKIVNYRTLLLYLHDVDFEYSIVDDSNRAADGMALRWRYIVETGKQGIADRVNECLSRPCSVLEMMIALAVRCEETIMDDPLVGNRTSQWFWGMITNLGLGDMYNNRFNEEYVDGVINIFLNRRYRPDGKGGLFTIRGCCDDLRSIDIWSQLCWYLDSIA